LICDEVVNTIVSYNMGWSKRGNSRSYNSLNGYAAIIGFLSKKYWPIQRGIANAVFVIENMIRKDYRKNFEGSLKTMEADAGVELLTKSKVLEDAKLSVGVLIGDEDSSTIANINKTSNKVVYKLADKNHLIKLHFVNDLYKLSETCKKLKKTELFNI